MISKILVYINVGMFGTNLYSTLHTCFNSYLYNSEDLHKQH